MILTFYFILIFLGVLWISFALSTEDFAQTIIVGQTEQFQFKTVQSAIDSIPDDNQQWIKIHIQAGTYR